MKPQLTIEAFADWAEKQPADEVYDFMDIHGCACFRYLSNVGLPLKAVSSSIWRDLDNKPHALPKGFNEAANGYGEPRTFGALAARLRAASKVGA